MPLISRRPGQHLVDLVGALGGTWSGYTAICRCPAHSDGTPSLSLRQGDRSILVHCYAGCSRSDVLRELRQINPAHSFAIPTETHHSGRGNVERIWQDALAIPCTLGEVYLRLRGLQGPLPDLRFHPRCPHGPVPRTQFKPALLVAVRDGNRLTAIQRIFLDPQDGQYTEKVMLGSPGQGAWQGGAVGESVAIAESFEDAAAFMQLGHGPCWTSLGAGRLHRLSFPMTIRSITIAEDNDAEGRRAARRAFREYRDRGLDVRRMSPPEPHKDWAASNAALRLKEERD